MNIATLILLAEVRLGLMLALHACEQLADLGVTDFEKLRHLVADWRAKVDELEADARRDLP